MRARHAFPLVAQNNGPLRNNNQRIICQQLQDYQMQLMLLEQQNKKRLIMARMEQDERMRQAAQGNERLAPAEQVVASGLGKGSEVLAPESYQTQMAQAEKQRMKVRLVAEQGREEEQKRIRGLGVRL
ncbi:hypothetical protein F4810DRAFT_688509 [Camillea tinctor]|nr:hypothetical protein F4810DRAFT_688509 [Camillea tinctor]